MFAADMHCDTISAIYHKRKQGEEAELFKNDLQVDLCKMKAGNYLLQNFAIFVDIGKEDDPYRMAKEQIRVFYEEMEKNKSKIRQVKTAEDLRKNQKEGKLSAVLTMEEGEICGGKIERLEEFYTAGIRMMTLTWNYPNSLADENGLTDMGITFVRRMEELGMIVDVSHLPEKGFYDVYKYSRNPFVASHSNAAALCRHKRNLSDDMIRKIAERGGVIGANYYGLFLSDTPENGIFYSRTERIAEHICHLIQTVGIGCVGLGSDFDGIDDQLELKDCSYMEFLADALRKKGLKESEIEAVFYKNVLNLYQEVF